MRKVIFTALIILITFIVTSDIRSQWTQSDGIWGGSVINIVSAGGNVFAATSNGLYYSTNDGLNWNLSSTISNVTCLASDGVEVVAGTHSGIYYSTNYGSNWSLINNIYTDAISVSGNTIVYATSRDVHIITDHVNFRFIFDSGDHSVLSVNILGNSIIVVNYIGLYISNDAGLNWISSLSQRVYCSEKIGSRFYIGTDNGVLFSDNNGSSWNLAGISAYSITALKKLGNVFYAGTYNNGVYYSTTDGLTWDHPIPFVFDITSITSNGNKLFAGSYSAGIFYSTNNGFTWTQNWGWINNQNIYCLAANDSRVFAGTRGNGIYISTNSGINWSNSRIFGSDVLSIYANNNYVYVGTNQNGIFKSSNNGLSWDPANFSTVIINSIVAKNDTVIAGCNVGIYRSTNNCSSWTQISDKYTRCLELHGSTLLAGISTGGILTTNNGLSWSSFLSNQIILKLKYLDGRIFAGTFSPGGVYVSSDNGISWSSNTLLNVGWIYSFESSGHFIFALHDYGMSSSYNYGNSWVPIGQGLPQHTYGSLAISGDNILCGTNQNSVLMRHVSEITNIHSIGIENNFNFNLTQNFPNPFNPVTKISFSLPVQGFVSLKVYDAIGREVKDLVNENMNAGSYNVDFDGAEFSSGIYFYSLNANGFSETKRMVLVK